MAQTLEQHRRFHAHTDRTAPETCDYCNGSRSWSESGNVVTTNYDDQSASWQQGYDDYYEWYADESDSIPMRAYGDLDWVDPVEYDQGWNHANYEEAYGS